MLLMCDVLKNVYHNIQFGSRIFKTKKDEIINHRMNFLYTYNVHKEVFFQINLFLDLINEY